MRDDRVEPESPTGYDRFGWSVALRGDELFVGSPQMGAFTGAVYSFQAGDSGWLQSRAPLVPDPAPPAAEFGEALAYDGLHLLVGAPSYDDPGPTRSPKGAAYAYALTGGDLVAAGLLRPPDPETDDGFGGAVAVHGEWAVVGADGEDRTADGGEGGAHAFHLEDDGTWTRVWSHTDGLDPGSALGVAVDLESGVLFLGAPADLSTTAEGTVRVMRLSGGTLVPSGTLSEASSPDFGLSLDAAAFTLVVSGTSRTHVYSFQARCTEDAHCDDGDRCTDDSCDVYCRHAPSTVCDEPPDAGVGSADAGTDGGADAGTDAGTDAGWWTPEAGPVAGLEAPAIGCACDTASGIPADPTPFALLLLVLRARRRSR